MVQNRLKWSKLVRVGQNRQQCGMLTQIQSIAYRWVCLVSISVCCFSRRLLFHSKRSVQQQSHLSSSSPSGDFSSNHSNSDTNSANKYPSLLDFIIKSTIKMSGYQFLLLAWSVYTWLLRKYQFPSSSYIVFVLLRVFSFFSFYPLRGISLHCLITDTSGGVKW